MRVALFNGPKEPITIACVEVPKPGPGEVLVRICRCGICGSDVSMTADAPFTYNLGPFGHEFSGEIAEVGSGVTNVKPGDRVACIPIPSCGRCEGCRFGNPAFCTSPRKSAGYYGGFTEYTVIPAEHALRMPQSISFAEGAAMEPLACGLHALRQARFVKGDRVLVLGAGSMALAVIYWARRLGAGKIVVLSRSDHRREIACAMGADAVHALDSEDAAAAERSLGGPPDVVVECVGQASTLEMAIQLVRPQGAVASLGMCMKTMPILPALLSFKEVRLLFPIAYSIDEFIETAKAVEQDSRHLEQTVSDVIALEALPDVLDELRTGTRKALKIQVDPAL